MKNLEAKIQIPKKVNGDYYVYIYDISSQKIIQKYYKGINTTLDPEERFSAAQDMQKALTIKLKSGWIPNVGKIQLKTSTISEALEQAILCMKGKVSKNTYDAYSGTVGFFLEAINSLKYSKLPTVNFTRAYAKRCLEWIVKDRAWSNHSYNKNLGYIRSVFSEIVEAEQAETNPFRDVKNLKVESSFANIPPTDEEMILICEELKSKNYGFYVFYMLIYYCGIRPDEARLLRVSHINFTKKTIDLPGEITKNGKFRSIPMLGNIEGLLSSCINEEKDYFVFGTWVSNGGRHSQKNWFSPNKYSIKEDTPNKQWKKLIKDGLGINKSLYSAKHKGADDKREAGMSIKTVSDIFGHSETKMTERYMHSLKLERFEAARKVKTKIF